MNLSSRILGFPLRFIPAAAAPLLMVAAALALSALCPAPAVHAQSLPAVNIMATTPTANSFNDTPGVFTLAIPTAQSSDFKVSYAIKGTAVNGTDYAMLSGTKKIKAGKTSVEIKVVPMGTSSGKTVKLVIKPGAAYEVGSMKKATVTIDDETIIVLP